MKMHGETVKIRLHVFCSDRPVHFASTRSAPRRRLYNKCFALRILANVTIFGTRHNLWHASQSLTHATISGTRHNLWHTPPSLAHVTISGTRHNLWQTPQSLAHVTISGTCHNLWHMSQSQQRHTTQLYDGHINTARNFRTLQFCTTYRAFFTA